MRLGAWSSLMGAMGVAIGLGLYLAGTLVSTVPEEAISWGLIALPVCAVWFALSYRFVNREVFWGDKFWLFMLCAGVSCGISCLLVRSLIAPSKITPVLAPLLVLTCYLEHRAPWMRRLATWSAVLALLLPLFAHRFLLADFDKHIIEEDSAIAADQLVEKNPPFIDDPELWREIKIEGRDDHYRINKSAAVISLSFAKFADKAEAKRIGAPVFPSYAKALAFAETEKLAIIPSVQMLDHKAKAFEDAFFAATERHAQESAEALGGGKRAFFGRLLHALIAAHDGSAASVEAIAYVAEGHRLGGGDLPHLDVEVDARCQALYNTFMAKPWMSKPVGFYAGTEDLERIFRQDRFYQQDLLDEASQGVVGIGAAVAMAKVFAADPALLAQYRVLLALSAGLTNPPAAFSIADLLPYSAQFGDPTSVERALMQSELWPSMRQRGGDPMLIRPPIALVPACTSKETQLFAQQPEDIPTGNFMNHLIEAIRNGTINLTPAKDSGWYDYQIHAMEALLLPERGQEGQKLLLDKAYRERLIAAFRSMLTKKRELHAKSLYVGEPACTPSQIFLTFRPELRLEPMATFYLRTARGYRFVTNVLESQLGVGALYARLDDSENIGAGLARMARLFYGLYLIVCEDIGMKRTLMEGELTSGEIEAAKSAAVEWLAAFATDPVLATDARYTVPILRDPDTNNLTFWMSLGIKLDKIKAEYARRPRIEFPPQQKEEASPNIVITVPGAGETHEKKETSPFAVPTDAEAGFTPGGIHYEFKPVEFYLASEVFAEVEGGPEPPTREEFRALCEKESTVDAVVAAIAAQAK